MPLWIFGCKVFILPPSISGEPVYFEISILLNFNFFISLYVPDELINSILNLESVNKQIKNYGEIIEIIICDNSNNDYSRKIVEKYNSLNLNIR